MKRTIILLITLIFTLVLCGCSEETAPQKPTDTGIHVTDMAGETVILKEIPRRILALSPSDCEILWAIGAGEQVIGRGSDCDWPQEILELPAVVSGANMNLEQVIAMNPDVVLMSRITQTQAQKEALEASGITVIYSDAHDNNETMEGVYSAMAMLGSVTGREAEAQKLIEDTKICLPSCRRTFPRAAKKRFISKYPLWNTACGLPVPAPSCTRLPILWGWKTSFPIWRAGVKSPRNRYWPGIRITLYPLPCSTATAPPRRRRSAAAPAGMLSPL